MDILNIEIINSDNSLRKLTGLKEIVKNSRVIALGEGAHFIREYWELRQHLFKFLHEECQFNFFAMEFGFAEGFKLENWIKGAGEKNKLEDYSESASKWGASETMLWLREYNIANQHKIKFAGIDIPEAGGTILPALLPICDYLKKVDNSFEILITELIEIAKSFSDLSSTKAINKWKNISPLNQYKLYAELNKIILRFKAMKHVYLQLSTEKEYEIAFRHLETAISTVYVLQASAEMFSGTGLPFDMSIREKFMADSIMWHLKHSEPDTRIVVLAHNNHIQKTPVQYGEYVVAYPMGFYLNEYLGVVYTSIGLTTTDTHIPDMELDDNSSVGFKVVDKEVGLPIDGSIENLLVKKGYKNKLSFIGLKNIEQTEELEKINCFRSQSAYITTSSIQKTFDGLISIPQVSLDKSVEF
ncbi:MAG: erythromycin esterase family protein [Mangrovibacterium sp.]